MSHEHRQLNDDREFPCPICGELITEYEDYRRFHSKMGQLSMWWAAHVMRWFR